jgi:hypothetical protein
MMREEDKPFICYQQSKWMFQITPRNAAGWRAFGLWMVAAMAPALAFTPFAITLEDTPQEHLVLWATIPLLLIMGVIIFAMIRWMKARSQIIDVNAVAKLHAEQARQAKKRGR